MKIAFFLKQFPVRSETFISRQARGLIAANHDVQIITMMPGEDWASEQDRSLFANRVTVLPTSAKDIKLSAIFRLVLQAAYSARGRRRLAMLRRALSRREIGLAKQIVASASINLGQFDAVLAHFGPIGVRAMAMREAGVFRGPLGTVFHGFDMSMTSVVQANLAKYRELFKSAEMMFPISRAWQSQLITWGCPPEKTAVMRMGVDLENLAGKGDRPARFGGPLRVVTVGRLVEKKGTADAIDAIRRSGFDVQLRVIGSGPLEHELKALADDTDKVVFMGAMDHGATLREVAAADVFLLPSVTAEDGDKEGIPVSLMEAMALGTLTVATQHSGNSELIDHGVSGWLVPERKPNDIIAILHSIYRDDLDLEAIRVAARAKIANDFDNAKLDGELVKALARLGDCTRHRYRAALPD